MYFRFNPGENVQRVLTTLILGDGRIHWSYILRQTCALILRIVQPNDREGMGNGVNSVENGET